MNLDLLEYIIGKSAKIDKNTIKSIKNIIICYNFQNTNMDLDSRIYSKLCEVCYSDVNFE